LKRLIYWTGLIVIGFVVIGSIWYYHMFITSPLDRPWIPSTERQTIEVTYVNWACDCADFVETKNFKTSPISEPEEDDYLFVEPAREEVNLDSTYYSRLHFSKNLKLTGRFYIDKGIPTSYEMKTPLKPEHAKVFLYDKVEFVNK
jgi:hypothetical protein